MSPMLIVIAALAQTAPSSPESSADVAVVYVMFGTGARGEPDGETTRFMNRAAAHLIEHQREDGSWKVVVKLTLKDGTTRTFLQPPLIDEDDVTTLWSLLVLTYRKPDGISDEAIEKSRANGFRYLSEQPLGDTLQSLVLRIMLDRQIGDSGPVPALVDELLSRQRDDGGWSQTKQLKSDALGTGQALSALSAAGTSAQHASIEKARRFLLRTQREDGTCCVLLARVGLIDRSRSPARAAGSLVTGSITVPGPGPAPPAIYLRASTGHAGHPVAASTAACSGGPGGGPARDDTLHRPCPCTGTDTGGSRP